MRAFQPAGSASAVWHGLVEEDDPSEPLPSELNTVDHPALRFLSVSKDKLTVRYIGRGNHSQDVGAIRTEWPCPQRSLVYYYEVHIADSGSRGAIAVGLADKAFCLNRQPGWEQNSYAYHGDGRRYAETERGENYGPRFATGDIIGCGLLSERREVFFTKNGTHLGVAFTDVSAVVYPTVGLHSPGERVTLNLGGAPFAFDIDGLVRQQRAARAAHVLATPPPAVDLDTLVKAYLMHMNYGRTLKALEQLPDGAVAPRGVATLADAPNDAPADAPADAPDQRSRRRPWRQEQLK